MTWSSSKAGTLITSLSAHQEHPAGEKLILPQTNFPLKSFPLIFSDRYQLLNQEDDHTEPQGEASEDRMDSKDFKKADSKDS